MRVSLCVICGNEEQYIVRMLNSFEGTFDQLSITRAVGSLKPDDTIGLAQLWCRERDIACVVSEYRNGIGAEGWDHVDDFAAARNLAFQNGDGEWLIWCDCDDKFVGDAKAFRHRLEQAGSDLAMVRCYYDVQGTGKKLYRERAIARDFFQKGRKWYHSVHENFLLMPGDKHEDWEEPVWLHAPIEVKKENRRRNLRILSHSVKEAATQYFYIHQEHFCSQNREAAIEFGKIALAFPNLQPAFRYETLLNLAKLSSSRRDANLWLMEAHGIYPWCREAIAAMILLNFEFKEYDKAKYWADRMASLREPLPKDRPWTHEVKWYGWAGYDLYARACRASGNKAAADLAQWQYHAGVAPKISLLHATRNRSSKAFQTREAWLNYASDPTRIEHIFAIDLDDATSVEMGKQFLTYLSPKQSCVSAWNGAARMAGGELLVQLSDDWMPVRGWDQMLLNACDGIDLKKEPVVIAVSDGHRKDDLLCMAILSRARYEQQGREVFHEGYESVFSDNEFSYRAGRDKVVIDARSWITFEHCHPCFGKAPMDATYRHNNQQARYTAGEALFRSRNPDAPQWKSQLSQS
jgi:hypothetical protein